MSANYTTHRDITLPGPIKVGAPTGECRFDTSASPRHVQPSPILLQASHFLAPASCTRYEDWQRGHGQWTWGLYVCDKAGGQQLTGRGPGSRSPSRHCPCPLLQVQLISDPNDQRRGRFGLAVCPILLLAYSVVYIHPIISSNHDGNESGTSSMPSPAQPCLSHCYHGGNNK